MAKYKMSVKTQVGSNKVPHCVAIEPFFVCREYGSSGRLLMLLVPDDDIL